MVGVRTIGRILLVICAGGFAYLAYIFLTMPDVRTLRTTNPATTAFIEIRAAQARARGEKPRRAQTWVPYGRISPDLTRAVLVAEDSAFWQHEGIDFAEIRESLEVNLKQGTFARGASTITQQLAKNLYLSPSKNPFRKLRELLIARRLEAELSKRRILEIYLNVIEWGDGIYGAEAAARAYFKKPAASLTAEEAALMAGSIFNPRVLNPGRPSPGLIRRQRLILQRMRIEAPAPVDPGGPSGASAPPQPYGRPPG